MNSASPWFRLCGLILGGVAWPATTGEPWRWATEAALETGALLREEFHRSGGPSGPEGRCLADETGERLIREKLFAAFPTYGYLGEETGGRAAVGQEEHLWLVDRSDGIKPLLRKSPFSSYVVPTSWHGSLQRGMRGSAVSIALLRHGEPALGVVYAFAAPDDGGDLFTWAEGCPLTHQGRVVEADLRSRPPEAQKVVLVSQDADRNPEANLRCVAPMRYRAMPSIAYRLALAVTGEGVAAVSVNSPGGWDYAAGGTTSRALRVTVGQERASEAAMASASRVSQGDPRGQQGASLRPGGPRLAEEDRGGGYLEFSTHDLEKANGCYFAARNVPVLSPSDSDDCPGVNKRGDGARSLVAAGSCTNDRRARVARG